MASFQCENFTTLDKEVIGDFFSCFHEAVEEIEDCCHRLEVDQDPDDIHDLFRSMHSLKGNCRMVFLDPLVEVCHKLEEIVSDIRDEKYSYNPIFGEFMLAEVSRIESLIEVLINRGEADADELVILESYINEVKDCTETERAQVVDRILDNMAGAIEDSSKSNTEGSRPSVSAETNPSLETNVSDLEFFYSLALKLDGLSLYKRERIAEVLKLCLKINTEMGNPVAADQLSAAVYLHDFAMALIPARILHKESNLQREEASIFYNHCHIGAELLRRMTGWNEAATMIEQHHERFDGNGFPQRIKGNNIHVGAMILAVVDTYQYVINQHSDKIFRKTLLRAVTEINSNSEADFDPRVVEAFNLVIRHQFVSH